MSNEIPTPTTTRRGFLSSSAGALGGAWLLAHWPEVVAAAHTAHESANTAGGTALKFLTAEEAVQVDAITDQIVPGGEKPGAREAHVVQFIDAALASFFADQAAGFRSGLGQFQTTCQQKFYGSSFASLDDARQREFLGSVDRTPFFETARFLTIAGLLASPKYGGNHDLAGWHLMGFEDQHVFEPPFGYYDRDYPGFIPYAGAGDKP